MAFSEMVEIVIRHHAKQYGWSAEAIREYAKGVTRITNLPARESLERVRGQFLVELMRNA